MKSIKQPLFETKAVSKATDQLMSVQTEQTITSLEVAELTGKRHDHVMRDIRVIVPRLGEGAESNFGLSEYKDTTGRTLPCYRLTKEGCLCLVSGYDANLRMKIINRWKELELQNQPQISTKDKIEAEFIAAKYCGEILNMNDASKLMVTQSIVDAYGLQLSLPTYASSKGVTKSLTECLKLVGSEIKPKEFNQRLADKGFIVQNTRYSSTKKKDEPFWTITNKGLTYGENKVHPHNQNETQPCWYVDKFKELYNLMK